MRRKARDDTPRDIDSTGSIKVDLTEKQLAALGAATLAYNILEDQIDALFFVTMPVPDWLSAEVSSRIHGLDGKVAIIHEVIKHSGLATSVENGLTATVATFADFKRTRDTMIHARIINASLGVGRGEKKRGKSPYEVLLSASALDAFYDHILALQKELSSGGSLLNAATVLKQSAADDPNRSQHEEAFRVHKAQFQENRNHRRSLKPLPKFPSEDELREAVNRIRERQITMRMGYPRPPAAHLPARDTPQNWELQYQRNNALLDTYFPPGEPSKNDDNKDK